MNVLMISSSRVNNGGYLQYSKDWIGKHTQDISEILFVPFAGVTISQDAYTQTVQEALPQYKIKGIHQADDPVEAVAQAKAIMVGGGNTFNLLSTLQKQALLMPIIEAVKSGVPYIGWSACANLCGPTICTTNDMPIIQPTDFNAFGFINAQINPHYTDTFADNFHGETRDQRIAEFCMLNPTKSVIGIREGSALLLKNNQLRLLGELPAVVFESHNKLPITQQNTLDEYI